MIGRPEDEPFPHHEGKYISRKHSNEKLLWFVGLVRQAQWLFSVLLKQSVLMDIVEWMMA